MENINYNELEFNSLREELIKRIEMRQNVVALVVTSAGVLLGFSIKTPPLAFLFPPLSLFLCLMWAQNDVRALQITDYLQTLENEHTKLGWTTFYRRVQGQGSLISGLPFSVFAPGGIFILTSLLAFGIGCSEWPSSTLYVSLLMCDILSIILMGFLVLFVMKSRIKRRNNNQNNGNANESY